MNLPDEGLSGQPFLQQPRVIQIRRTLRAIWLAMIFSMGWVSYVLFHSLKERPSDSPILPVAAAICAIMSFVAPDWIASHARPGPTNNPMDTKLGMILINHILRFALTEAALMMMLLWNPAPTAVNSACLYGLAAALMIYHFPSDSRMERLAA
ncbi:MAG: hypothetical protein ACXVA9_13135 [Bdellovibrionales bacterium]